MQVVKTAHDASNWRGTYKLNRYEFSSSVTKNKAGNYIGRVYGPTITSYPDNGSRLNLWYNYIGEQ